MRLSYAKNSETNQIEILDRNDYYAFGMNMYEQNSVYDAMGTPLNYKYNGKELQETGMYDYGWRQYMPDLGRWFGMDQLSEKYNSASPYAYVANNPIMNYDPDGRVTQDFYNQIWGSPSGTTWTNNNDGTFGNNMGDIMNNDGSAVNFNTSTGYYGGRGNMNLGAILIPTAYVSGNGWGKQAQKQFNAFMDVINENTKAFDWGETSQNLRKIAGYGFTVSKMLEAGYKHASLYGKPAAYTTTSLYFEKSILGKKILSVKLPFRQFNAEKGLKLAGRMKVAGTVLGAAGAGLGVYDMIQNGVTTSNTLDTTMSALAATPTGVTQGIAGAYFMLNFISTVTTGQDIGQHLDANGYNLGEYINSFGQ